MKAAALRFQKFCVTDGVIKARVFYSLDNRVDGRKCVTLYAKTYDRNLGKLLAAQYQNDTDSSSDYFDQGRAVIFEGDALYPAARARAEAVLNVKPAEPEVQAVLDDRHDKASDRRFDYLASITGFGVLQ